MQKWKQRLESLGRVETFDYDYMRSGRKRPDPPSQLIAAHRQALAQTRGAEELVVLIGKSMGGRIGCHVSLEEKVSALICFGYPLCGGGDPARMRDKVLRDLTTPILFVQGTRDPLCPVDLLEKVRSEMRAPNTLHRVEGGDHSLMVRKTDLKRIGKTQEDVDAEIFAAIGRFSEQLAD